MTSSVLLKTKESLEQKVLPVIINFLKERGLELSLEKTKITHIQEGFDFLVSTCASIKDKLLIKPGKKGTQTFLEKVRETIKLWEHARLVILSKSSILRLEDGQITTGMLSQGNLFLYRQPNLSPHSGGGRKEDTK